MKHTFLSLPIRVLLITVSAIILGADALSYYQVQAQTLPPQPSPTPLSSIEVSPSPTSKPIIKSNEPLKIQTKTFNLLRKVDRAHIEAAQTSFVGGPVANTADEVSIYQLNYDIQGKDGSWKPITAKVFIPTNVRQAPLFVFGSGTTGLADKCAPSLENMAVENVGNYDNHLITQAAAGYTAVFPDYEGFHDADTQAYFVSESEAKVLLGAIDGLLELQPKTAALQTSDLYSVFLAGYSQGGHAALAAASNWQQLPPTVRLKGVIQYAGAADVEALFLDSPWLAAYLADSYAQYYGDGLDPSLVLQDRWLIPLAQNNQSLCVNQAYKQYPHTPATVYTPGFLDAIETHTWPSNLAAWQNVIKLNTPTEALPDVPYLSIQGDADPIVTAKTQTANVKQLCSQHHAVVYKEYPGVNHFQIRQQSLSYSDDWMSKVLHGQTLESSCPN